MDADRNVTVTFTKLTYALTVTKDGSGVGSVISVPPGIDCGATCTANYEHGSTVTLTATPGANSTFAGWGGACTGSGSCVVTVNGIRGVTANFVIPDATAPRIISGPLVAEITSKSATVMWQTDEDATTSATWGSTGTAALSGYRTNHAVAMGGLSANTTYTVSVTSSDRAGNPSESKSVAFKTTSAPDVVAPLIVEGPTVAGISENRAVVSWTTNEAATSVIAGDLAASVAELVIEHEVELTGLAPLTRYAMTVSSADAAGNPSVPRSLAFTTLAAADTTPPVITKGPLVVGVGMDSATVLWETDEAAGSQARFEGAGSAVTGADERMKTSHSVRVKGLAPATDYAVTVSATDAFGNGPTRSAPVNVTTAAVADGTAPVVIGPIEVCDRRADLLLLCFRTDEPASALVNYGPADGAMTLTAARAQLVREHRIALGGLNPNATYRFQVVLTDGAGNMGTSAIGSATTTDQPVSLTVLSGPTLAYTSNDRVLIVWTTNKPATSLVEYGTTGFDSQVADGKLVTSHSVLVTGLQAGTAYQFRITSTDVAGNNVRAGL